MEEEKERALGLQRKERELRERLLSLLLSRKSDDARPHEDLLRPVLDILQTVSSGCAGAAALHPLVGPPPPGAAKEAPPRPDADCAPRSVNGSVAEEAPCKEGPAPRRPGLDGGSPEKRCAGVLSCIPDNNQQPKGVPACDPSVAKKEGRSEQDKCNREPSKGRGRASREGSAEDRRARERSRARRAGSREDGRPPRKERRSHRKHASKDGSPRRSASPRRSRSKDRRGRRERSRERRGSAGRKRSRHRRRSQRSRSRSPSRHRSAWNR